MTVEIHVIRSKNLILNSSRSTDVKTKYQHQQTNINLNSLAFSKKSINQFEKSHCTQNSFETGIKIIYTTKGRDRFH